MRRRPPRSTRTVTLFPYTTRVRSKVDTMAGSGIDMGPHRPKGFDDLEDGFFDLILSLSPEAQHRSIELTRTMACDIEYWPTLDATMIEGNRSTRLDACRAVRDELDRRIRRRFAELTE